MADTGQTYQSNGNYVLNCLKIFTQLDDTEDEVVWDLRKIFIECSLFESIEDQVMTGYVSVTDSLDLNVLLRLSGGERVELEFYTAGAEDNTITYVGYIYKISQKMRLTEHTGGYKISFGSYGMLNSERIQVQDGFEGTCGEIANRLFNQYIQDDKTEKTLLVQPTKGPRQYTFGTVKPLRALEILAQNAISIDDQGPYYFFENNLMFNFVSLPSLYQQEPVAKYRSTQAGMYKDVTQRAQEQFESIQDIIYHERNSYLDKVMDGLHGSNYQYFDIVTKQFFNQHLTNEDIYDQQYSLGDHPNLKQQLEYGDDKNFLHYLADDLPMSKSYARASLIERQADLFTCSIIVFGDSYLKAGTIIEVDFPKLFLAQKELKNEYDGRVLIRAIRHTITHDSYFQELEVSKDAYTDIFS